MKVRTRAVLLGGMIRSSSSTLSDTGRVESGLLRIRVVSTMRILVLTIVAASTSTGGPAAAAASVIESPVASVVASVNAKVVATADAEATSDNAEEEPVFHFDGGGWGHGVGMSQYGALGRAEAGFNHTEILQFYYQGTDVVAAPELVHDDVDVRIAVHNTTTFWPTGQLTVAMDGSFLDTTVNRLKVRRGDGGWYINSSNIDWCRGFCPGTVLTVSFNDGEPVKVTNTDNGSVRYAHGQFQLTPADTGAANCGSRSAHQYCLVIGELTMKQYLYGIAEVPYSWHTEALKVQAIAARSYAAAKMRERSNWNAPFDLYSWSKDQTYRAWDKESAALPARPWADAVDATEDVVVIYTPAPTDDGEQPAPFVATAFYTTTNGGYTAASEEPWRSSIPYLIAKPDPYDAAPDTDGTPKNPLYEWRRSYTGAEVSRWLTEYPIADLDVGDVSEIRITDVGPSGRIDDALVTLVGSKRTMEVRKPNGDPYGYRFYYALFRGCEHTPGCHPMLSTKVEVSKSPEEPTGDPEEVPDDSIDSGSDEDNEECGDGDGDGEDSNACDEDNEECGDGDGEDSSACDEDNEECGDGDGDGEDSNACDEDNSEDGDDNEENDEDGHRAGPLPNRFNPEAMQPSRIYRASKLPFNDVSKEDPYAEAVAWMLNTGITEGTNNTAFSPDAPITRGQFAAWLWRFAGSPELSASAPAKPSDLDDDSAFIPAVRWMLDNGITYGCGASDSSLFCPHDPVTSAHVAAFLWRFAGSTPSATVIYFNDVITDSFYLVPTRWMLDWDLWVDSEFKIASHRSRRFNPDQPVPRGRVAVYLWNLAEAPGAFTPSDYLPPFMRDT